MIYLCGTKMDLLEGDEKVNRQVDYHDVLDYAESKTLTRSCQPYIQ